MRCSIYLVCTYLDIRFSIFMKNDVCLIPFVGDEISIQLTKDRRFHDPSIVVS